LFSSSFDELAELALTLGDTYLSLEESVAALRSAGDAADLERAEQALAGLPAPTPSSVASARRLLRAARSNEIEHVVAFYEDDAFLVAAVSPFLSEGLSAGETVVVVATPEHRDGFEAALRSAGHDVARARREGRYVSLDAAGTLETLIVDGQLDLDRFEAAIGQLLREATLGGRCARLYGEMVSLLWNAGHIGVALELEDHWNRVLARVPLPLMCGYPLRSFETSVGGARFHELCGRHTAVTSESYAHLDPVAGQRSNVVVLNVEEPGGRQVAAGTITQR
jgi:hypothetical protein